MSVALLCWEISTSAAQVALSYIVTSLPAPGHPGTLVISQELVVIFPES